MAVERRKRWQNGRYNRLFEGKSSRTINMKADARFDSTIEKLLATGKWTNQAELLMDLVYRFSRIEHPEWDLPVLPLSPSEQEKQLGQVEQMIAALQLNA